MVCPSCGMKNNYYHRYCFHCGRQLTSEESLEKESSEKISFSSDADGLLLEEEADSSLTEGLENPDDQAFSSSLPDTDIFDDFLLDFSAKDKEESAFDIQSHMPLRRYRKAEKSEDVLLKVIKTLITIVLIALIGILAYVGYAELIKNRADNQPVAKVIDFDYRVEETELSGQPARKILVISSAGEQIKVRDEVFLWSVVRLKSSADRNSIRVIMDRPMGSRYPAPHRAGRRLSQPHGRNPVRCIKRYRLPSCPHQNGDSGGRQILSS